VDRGEGRPGATGAAARPGARGRHRAPGTPEREIQGEEHQREAEGDGAAQQRRRVGDQGAHEPGGGRALEPAKVGEGREEQEGQRQHVREGARPGHHLHAQRMEGEQQGGGGGGGTPPPGVRSRQPVRAPAQQEQKQRVQSMTEEAQEVMGQGAPAEGSPQRRPGQPRQGLVVAHVRGREGPGPSPRTIQGIVADESRGVVPVEESVTPHRAERDEGRQEDPERDQDASGSWHPRRLPRCPGGGLGGGADRSSRAALGGSAHVFD
jgi:hypothetical protein